MNKNTLCLTALFGALLIGIGFYLLASGRHGYRNILNSSASESSEKTISVPFQNYTKQSWNEYAPGYDGESFQNAANIWMRSKGQLTYLVNVSGVMQGDAAVTVRMSSEIKGYGKYGYGAKDSSDTVLLVNNQRLAMKNIIADDGIGEDYVWEIPEELLKAGTNELTFRVGDGKYSNGLTIYSPIVIEF